MAGFCIIILCALSMVIKPSTSQYCDADGINCKEGDYYDMGGKLLVAAIDIGTSYSGWAYAYKSRYKENPTDITVRKWYSGDHVSLKAPTSVLINPDGETLDSFGYDAETRYSELTSKDEHLDYYYFKHFKMMLDGSQSLTKETKIKDERDRELPAIKVFSAAIRFLREDLNETLRLGQILELEESHIQWVLTVPAIWNEKAKQFMRLAAVEAGINNDDLKIALEPEAASLYVRKLQVKRMDGEDGHVYTRSFESGNRYMVIDAGGGTVDITVHELLPNGHLKELLSADGGPWGGTNVNKAFLNMFNDFLGNDVIEKFRISNADDYLDLMRDFEITKRKITDKIDTDVKIRLPTTFRETVKRVTGKTMSENIVGSAYEGKLHQRKDKLYISPEVSKSLFQASIDNIIYKVKSLLMEPSVAGTSALLLVGGYSESRLLQQAIRTAFADYNFINPQDAGAVVLKGAVIFGYEPYIISERVCRYTYGVRTATGFEEGKHDKKKRFFAEGHELCSDIFLKFVQKGETVKLGKAQGDHILLPLFSQQAGVNVAVYACTMIAPMYTTDEGCNELGHVSVDFEDASVSRFEKGVQISFTFADTEIKVKATELRTGKSTSALINFLENFSE